MKLLNVSAAEVLARAKQRGVSPESIEGCIVERRGDRWIVDVEHEAYPRGANVRVVSKPPQSVGMLGKDADFAVAAAKHMAASTPVVVPSGPGTELKALLSTIGIKASPTCSCNTRANTMDQKGICWCEQNIDTIVSWLREEATKRKLPFVDMAGRLLVRRAIHNAKKKATGK